MNAALITATFLGVSGLAYSVVTGFLVAVPADVGPHVTLAIFSTLITLLAHSMTMFYLIGKGKAIREAVTDGGLPDEFYRAVARARRPVFSIGTMAMGVTMLTAILGGAVDTNILPVGVHSLAALATIAANIFAFRVELVALLLASETVTKVNELLVQVKTD